MRHRHDGYQPTEGSTDATNPPTGGSGVPPRNAKPEWLEHLSVLRLEPGDTIVLRTESMMTHELAAEVKRQTEQWFPGHKCIVLSGGLEIGVVRDAATESGPVKCLRCDEPAVKASNLCVRHLREFVEGD